MPKTTFEIMRKHLWMLWGIVFCFAMVFFSLCATRKANGAEPSLTARLEWTFDDGPHARSATHILKLLDLYCIRATWYVSGNQLLEREHRILLREIAKRRHTLGNHLWTHQSACKLLGPVGTLQELRKTERWIRAALMDRRFPLDLYRPPMGHRCVVVDQAVRAAGYRIRMWHVSDYRLTAERFWRQVLFHAKRERKVTLLFHHRWQMLRDVLVLAERAGYVTKCK